MLLVNEWDEVVQAAQLMAAMRLSEEYYLKYLDVDMDHERRAN